MTPLPALPVEAGTLGQLLVPGCTVSPSMSHSLLRACGTVPVGFGGICFPLQSSAAILPLLSEACVWQWPPSLS